MTIIPEQDTNTSISNNVTLLVSIFKSLLLLVSNITRECVWAYVKSFGFGLLS